MANQEAEAVESYLSDRPLDGYAGDQESVDLFGWGRHAERIAKAILANSHERAFVVGLHGAWGSGKSTLLNFVEAKLREQNKSITIFRYNPWLYPEVNHVQNFFLELAKAATFESDANQRAKLQKLLKRMAMYTDASHYVANAVKATLIFAVAFLLLTGVTFDVGFLGRLVLLGLGAVSALLAAWTKALNRIAEWFTTEGLSDDTLNELKSNLNTHLSKLKKPIVVMIDDIDRLPPSDICEIFQLVKNNGDLSNVTYLLAFDKEVVQSVLRREYHEQYRAFTDKIVQLEFGVPAPDTGQLERFFVIELDKVLKEVAQESAISVQWDVERWSNSFHWHLRKFIRTVRDAKRVLNSVHLGLRLVFQHGQFEVDPVDFVTIEILRVLHPTVYEFAKRNKDLLVNITEPTKIFGLFDDEKKALQERYDVFVESLGDPNLRDHVKEILQSMFPKLALLRSGASYESYAVDQDRAAMRIRVEDVYDRYFIYGNYVGDLPNALIRKIDLKIRSQQHPIDEVEALRNTDGLRVLFDQLKVRSRSHLEADPSLHSLMVFVLSESDYLIDTDKTTYTQPVRLYIVYVIRELLEPLDPEARVNLLKSAYSLSEGVFGLVMFAAITQETYDKEPQSQHIVPPEYIKELVELAKHRGQKWLAGKSVVTHNHMILLLNILKKWIEASEMTRALDRALHDERDFKLFITRFLVRTETRQYGAIAGKVDFRYNFEGLGMFRDLPEVYARLVAMRIDESDTAETQKAIEIFKQTYPQYDAKQRQ